MPEVEGASLSVATDADALRRRAARGLGAATFALLLILAFLGFAGTGGATTTAAAPAFDLALIDGGRVTDAGLAGRVTVLNVWASWCPPCREEAPTLRRVHERADPRAVAFLGVIRDDDPEDARAFAGDFGLTYPNAIADAAFLAGFNARGIPMTFVLDAAGQIVARHFGPISESKLTALIDDAVARSAAAGSRPPNDAP